MKFFPRRSDDDFSAEVQAHIDLETDRLVDEGQSPAAARVAARRAFGNTTRARERFHEANHWMLIEQLAQDVRYAARTLRQSPAFLLTSVLTLAVGLGLVTAAFTLFNTYVLRPYAVADPSNLYQVEWQAERPGEVFRWREYEELRGRTDLFDAVVAEGARVVSSDGRTLVAALVSRNYFESLRPPVRIGRPLTSADATSGNAVVLGHDAWARIYGADPSVIGREIAINGRPFVVVGVLDRRFVGLGAGKDVWLPFEPYAAVMRPELVAEPQPRSVSVNVRLRDGVSAAHAEGALAGFAERAVESRGAVRARVTPHGSPAPLTVDHVLAFLPVFTPFALVLVAACANLSNIMLARAIARQREIAVRLSLGASRSRVVRQLVTEGLLIAALAGLLGLGLGAWMLGGGISLVLQNLPPGAASLVRPAPVEVDHRVFVFAVTAAAAATLLFALLPALRVSRVELSHAVRGSVGAPGASRLRNVLVTAQVGVSVLLVVVAISLARNGASLATADLGYDSEGVVSVSLREQEPNAVRRLEDVLRSDPRVDAIAATNGNPLFDIDFVAGRGSGTRRVAVRPDADVPAVATPYLFVSPEYFTVLRLPLVHGRPFTPAEGRAAARVAIVSATTARRFWPEQNPIGQVMRLERAEGRRVDDLPEYSHVTVVGVTGDHIAGMVMEGYARGQVYLPIAPGHPRAAALLVRERVPGELDAADWQEVFRRVAADPQIFEAMRLNEMRTLQAFPLLVISAAGTLLGFVALALSISGLYGVLLYTVTQRTREIGIRMALGSTAGAVVGLVTRQSARLSAVGVAVGLLAAFAVLRVLQSFIRLHNVHWIDAGAFAAGVLVVLAAAGIAAWHPARRAARVDPSEALRADA